MEPRSRTVFSFRLKLAALFILAGAVLLIVGSIVVVNARDFLEQSDRAGRSQLVLEKIKASLYRLAMSESEFKGYLLSPDSAHLADFVANCESLSVRLNELKALTAERGALRGRVDSVAVMVEELPATMNAALRARTGESGMTAAKKASAGATERLRVAIEEPLERSESEERFLLGSLQKEMSDRSRYTVAAFFSGGFLSIALFGVALLLVRRENSLRRLHEEARMESEGKYRHLVESANDILYQTDLRGRFTYVNPVAIRYTGYAAEEVIGKLYLDLIVDGYKNPARRFYLHQATTDTPTTYYEFPILTKTGEKRWLGQNVQLLKEAGTLIGFQAVARDITDRKKSEAELRESQRRLQVVIDTVSDGVTFSDEEGRFTVFNRRMRALTGYTMEEANGAKDFSRLLYPDPVDHQRALDGVKEVQERGSVFDLETTIRAKDGRRLVLSVSTSLVHFQDRTMFLSTYRDITDRRRAEKSLEESEARFRELYDGAPVGYHEIDRDGRITSVNRTELAMLGFNAEEMLGHFVWEFVKDPQESEARVRTKLATRSGDVSSGERTYLRKDGKEVPVLIDERLQRDAEGRVRSIRTTLQDISQRKAAESALREAKEAAEAATKAKSEFLAAMSHEIRTPMNGVIGMTDLLLNTELSDEQREFAETIRTSGESLLTVINDILDFSKIESGRIELDQHPFELVSCIEEVFHLMSPKALEKNLDLLYLIDPKVPPYVVGDVLRLRQIIFNLVGNAVKFTSSGDVYVSVGLNKSEDGKIELEFSVKDTGIGIPEAKRDRLFKAFSQVDSSTTRRFGGTGLGLAISSRLVELMGGRIWVESTEGKGSNFHFTAVMTASPVSTAPKVFLKGNIPELRQKRVLIVDDNPTNLHILTLQCSQWEMIPRSTTSPAEALSWVRKGDPFDLAILDMLMPGMDGAALGKEIRALRPGTSLPIILLTSSGKFGGEGEQAEGIFSAYVSKPIRQSQLYEIIVGQLHSSSSVVPSRHAPQTFDRELAKRLPMKILVAEDNTINQKLTLRVLKQMGYEGEVAEDGRQVLTALETSRYDLIFMDVHMPELDGLDTTRYIVAHYAPQDRPVIVAMTADAMVGDREKCLEAGMDDYLSKPISIETMQQTLERWGKNTARKTVSSKPTASPEALQDETILRRMKELGAETDPAFAMTLIDTFLDDALERIARITEALKQGKADKVYFDAHTLRGGCLSLGALNLAAILHTMEESAMEGRLEGLEKILREVNSEFEKTRELLLALRRKGESHG
ncbi:MAG TPA: PAS domain S-box protein [Bacteroidota bacterium]|nr:PAS domain S-box protein [Bacteroidota bacterium]